MQDVMIELMPHAYDIPKRATDGSSGYDLNAGIEIIIAPKQWYAVSTGIKMVIPQGFEGLIRSRSGLALKHGISVLNSPGTIDSDYRGEIKVILINNSNNIFKVEQGMKIAQIIFAAHETPTITPINSIESYVTKRGECGFGSTGIKIAVPLK